MDCIGVPSSDGWVGVHRNWFLMANISRSIREHNRLKAHLKRAKIASNKYSSIIFIFFQNLIFLRSKNDRLEKFFVGNWIAIIMKSNIFCLLWRHTIFPFIAHCDVSYVTRPGRARN